MVVLADGTPLTWEETKALAEHARQHATKQFVYRWQQVKDVTADPNIWGDELECTLVKFNHEQRTVKALLRAEDIMKRIGANTSIAFEEWAPEYSSFMLEGHPRKPFNGLADCAEKVEESFRKRRVEIDELLESDETIMTLGVFPLIGCQDFTYPPNKPDPKHSTSGSIMFPDEAIFQHSLFLIGTRNITERRGRGDKPAILVPVFRDENTPTPFHDDLSGYEATDFELKQLKDDHIYMDGVPFGGSCCSLQVTTQCKSFEQAMHLRDQLIALCPILLALSAATPIFRGVLADTDIRWNVLRCGLDDRTAEERGETPLSNDTYVIPCARVDSMDMYMSDQLKHLNDFPTPIYLEAYNAFRKAEIHPKFAEDMAHLLIRDPMVLYKEQLSADDHETIDDFEGFHQLHLRTMRVKIPPKDGSSGWKVEFRPTEIQLIESQNAAFAVFAYLIGQLIQDKTTQFAIPISKVFSNMASAEKRDAVTKEKFWWRTSVSVDSPQDFAELSADEIINGNPDIGLPGVAVLVEEWVDRQTTISEEQKLKLHDYISLVRRRADGSSKTNARWMRDYVRSHVDYRQDSIVPECVVYDMLKLIHDVNWGKAECHNLVG